MSRVKQSEIIITVLIAYISLALLVYMCKHPAKTQTQIMFDFIDAMLWR